MPKSDFSRKFLRLLKPETKKYYLFFEIFTFKNNLKFVTLYSSQSFFIGKACIHVPQFWWSPELPATASQKICLMFVKRVVYQYNEKNCKKHSSAD